MRKRANNDCNYQLIGTYVAGLITKKFSSYLVARPGLERDEKDTGDAQ